MLNKVELTTPLSSEDIKDIQCGDRVFLSGKVYTARDSTHQRLFGAVREGEELPFDPEGQVIFYAAPTPARPGRPLGAVGPSSSYRMDPYTIPLLEKGIKCTVGKGPRSSGVRDAMIRCGSIYCVASGGASAYLSGFVTSSKIAAFPELGTEAIRVLEVKKFPLICVNDIYGNDLYEKSHADFLNKQ